MPIETQWTVPAITSGTPQVRRWRNLYRHWPFRTPRKLRVDNHRGNAVLTLSANGEVRTIGKRSILTFTEREVGPFAAYTIDASADTSLGDVVVYEIMED